MSRVYLRPLRSMFLGLGVFLVCLMGILSKPDLGLSAFWPANAFALGMLVRFSSLRSPLSWLCCAAGFFLADVVTGSDLPKNLILNGGNLATISTGYWLLTALPRQDRMLTGATSTFYLLRAILVASLVAGLIGIFANPYLFQGTSEEGFLFWTATEMVNYAALLPMFLTIPRVTEFSFAAVRRGFDRGQRHNKMPLLALIASAAGGAWIGGPGALAFPVPALLWCALTYDLFLTSCLSFAFALWTLFALRNDILWLGVDFGSRSLLISTRLGVSLVAFAPLVVGSVMAARNDLLEKLRFLADHDAMTGLCNRRAFLESGADVLTTSLGELKASAVMMLDIDHFKSVNDRYGHKAGDHVLAAFAGILKNIVRSRDIVGRIGGEEFAIVLPDCSLENAALVANRINEVVRSTAILLENGDSVQVTVSIGIHIEQNERNLERLLTHADEALYRAKNIGRDRFELSSGERRDVKGGEISSAVVQMSARPR